MQARVVNYHGVNSIEINGKIFQYVGYRSWTPKEKYLRAFDDLGFPFMTMLPSGIKNSLGVPYSPYGESWIGEGKYDWDVLRRQIDDFVNYAPHTYILLNIMLDTRDWFLKEHPDCPNSFIYFTAACAYKPWIEAASQMVKDTIDFVEREYPEKVFGIMLSAGGTCEWHNKAPDFLQNENRLADFRRWCGRPDAWVPTSAERAETGDDAARRGGDHDVAITDTLQYMPAPKNAAEIQYGMFRDPVLQKNTMDFYRYSASIVIDTLRYFARLVKTHTNNRLLVGAPVGYIMNAAPVYTYMYQALQMKELDLIACPASYSHRTLDSVSSSQTGLDAVRLNGKVMVHSVDNVTYAGSRTPYGQMLLYAHIAHENMDQSINYIRRETAMAMAKGAGFWFFDMYACWYPEEKDRYELYRIKEAYGKILEKPVKYTAQVAMLMDTTAILHSPALDQWGKETNVDQREELGHMGCPVDFLSVYDLLLPDFPDEQYKLMILPSCFSAGPELRDAVNRLRKKGVSFLFYHAAGGMTETGLDYEAASDFTGIHLCPDPEKAFFTLVEKEHNCLGYDKIYGHPRKLVVTPAMTADDPDIEVWGKDMFSQKPRLALKKREKGFDAWTFRGPVPAGVLRKIALEAGVFMYQDHGLPTYANGRMAAFFDHKGGKREITFPYKGKMLDYYTGKEYVSDGTPLQIEFKENECKLFIYED